MIRGRGVERGSPVGRACQAVYGSTATSAPRGGGAIGDVAAWVTAGAGRGAAGGGPGGRGRGPPPHGAGRGAAGGGSGGRARIHSSTGQSRIASARAPGDSGSSCSGMPAVSASRR